MTTQSFSANTHLKVEPERIQNPWLGRCSLRANLRGRNNSDVPREVLVEPVGIGMPGVYVARVANRFYTQEELDTLGDLQERSVRKTGTSRDKGEGEVNADEVTSTVHILCLDLIIKL
jgi:hypothetical protein